MDGVAGDSSSDQGDAQPPAAPPLKRLRRQRPLVLLILLSATGFWTYEYRNANMVIYPCGENTYLVGAVLADWCFESPISACDKQVSLLRRHAVALVRGAVKGFIQYHVREVVSLRREQILEDFGAQAILDLRRDKIVYGSGAGVGDSVLAEVVSAWRRRGASVPSVVTFSPKVALAVAWGTWVCMHVVALTSKTSRARVLGDAPTSRACSAFASQQDADYVRRPVNVMMQTVNGAAADLVIDWLRASGFIKDIKKSVLCADAYARLFARRGVANRAELMLDLERINREVLRQARVRFDMFSMLLFRLFWASLPLRTPNLYFSTDGSPQWRGQPRKHSNTTLVSHVFIV
jgi:hypothetical protein